MNWKEVIKIYFNDNLSFHVEIGPIVLILSGIILVLILLYKIFIRKDWGIKNDIELNVKFGGIGELKIKPNHDLEQIAHKAWVELATRKAGILFDQDSDVIVEVYNSWSALFGEIRSLVKEIPANQIKNKDTQLVVGLLINSLNDGLRPHLTRWQAKFRKWYENESNKPVNKNKSPQEVQKKYPHYQDLIVDLLKINKQMVSYTGELKKIFE